MPIDQIYNNLYLLLISRITFSGNLFFAKLTISSSPWGFELQYEKNS